MVTLVPEPMWANAKTSVCWMGSFGVSEALIQII